MSRDTAAVMCAVPGLVIATLVIHDGLEDNRAALLTAILLSVSTLYAGDRPVTRTRWC